MHGAGYKKRPGGAGSPRKPGGRPPTVGLYSERVRTSLIEALKDYRNDPSIIEAHDHLVYACALRDRAAGMLEATEAEVRQLAESGALKGNLRASLGNRLMMQQGHLALIVEKASHAQDRWFKQTHGEKFQWVDMPIIDALMTEVDKVLGKYVDAGKVEQARKELAEAIDRIDGPPQTPSGS